MLSKSSIGLAVGAAATVGFLGYCVYFDHKRRNDPSFKEKLKEKRKNAKKTGGRTPSKLPDLTDSQAVQQFFLQEVQLGEELLANGDIEGGVDHLSSAVAVCGQPQQLLGVLQQTLPPQIFQLLIQRLPSVTQKMASSGQMPGPAGMPFGMPPGGMPPGMPAGQMVLDDDLE